VEIHGTGLDQLQKFGKAKHLHIVIGGSDLERNGPPLWSTIKLTAKPLKLAEKYSLLNFVVHTTFAL